MCIGEETSTRSAGGRRLLRRLNDRYLVDARVREGDRLWLKTQVGPCAVEPSPSYLFAVAYKLAEA